MCNHGHMRNGYINTGINIRLDVWRRFKAYCALHGLKIQYALSEAVSEWLEKREAEAKDKDAG